MPRRKPSRPSTGGLSSDAKDKMLAALTWMVATPDANYVAPRYFDACRAWYKAMSCEQRETVSTAIDAYIRFGEIAAKRIAASLPPAPRCPL